MWRVGQACLCLNAMTHINLSESADLSHRADTKLPCEMKFLCALSLSLFLNIKRESPVKAFWGHWLTHVGKHTHIGTVSLLTLCVNNPAINDCRIIRTCVGSHTHTCSQKASLMRCGDTMALCQHLCKCVCPCSPPDSWLQTILCWFAFFLACCKSADDGLARG